MLAEFPEKLEPLFKPSRYKVLDGGRGGGKSWGIARALLILGAEKPLRVLCAREFQASIKESVHELLASQVKELGLDHKYEVLNNEIRRVDEEGNAQTSFSFAGLRRNITNIKSYEGCDICWVEEAQTVSKASWDILIPTIRKPGSEIWISFNPQLEEDETYKRFIKNPPPGTVRITINWYDNPWFSDVLRLEKDHLQFTDPEAYENVWEGQCRQTVDGAVYGKEMAAARKEGRITKVPYDPIKPVHTIWDLGWGDNTAIWFYQGIGFERRMIDYEQVSQTKLSDIVKMLQEKPYTYGIDVLPHDAKAKTLAADGKSIQDQLAALGRNVRICRDETIAGGINAARTIFPTVWFDEENCADGLQCLRHYRYDIDTETGQVSKKPLHDNYSHGADGFRYFALEVDTLKETPDTGPIRPLIGSIC